MMNISLVGRLTKQVELKKFPSEKGETIISNGTIAVKRKKYNKRKGERETTFINFQAWGKDASTLADYTAKGSLIELTGDFINNNYTDKNKVERYELVFEVDNLELLETKADTERRQAQQQQQPNLDSHQPTLYEQQQQNQYQEAFNRASNQGNQYQQQPIDGMNQYGGNTYHQ
ncbi:single-stranded DNA-binding protein [Enterococcus sp. DIV2324]|uniref:single-stranded DNA-binding protein n=1 Tax=Enterococcus sp. DIV2324 TaxID=2774763 RepID=UPI003F29E206